MKGMPLPAAALTVLLALWLSAACTRRPSLLPASSGGVTEVLVVGNTAEATEAVATPLRRVMMAGLPQPEQRYDVSTATGALTDVTKYVRCIVEVELDPALYTKARVSYRRDVYARRQFIIRIQAPSVRELLRHAPTVSRTVHQAQLSILRQHILLDSSGEMEQAVLGMAGYRMGALPGMRRVAGRGAFLWWQADAPACSQNLCVYTYPGDRLGAGDYVARRDSVMKQGIKGEQEGMYMQTYAPSVVYRTFRHGRLTVMEARGLWEMKGDAMGGPFISYSIADSSNHRIVVAEGFVYAPGRRKRDRMLELEAALSTLRPASQGGE